MRKNNNVGATSSRPHIEESTKNSIEVGSVLTHQGNRGITLTKNSASYRLSANSDINDSYLGTMCMLYIK